MAWVGCLMIYGRMGQYQSFRDKILRTEEERGQLELATAAKLPWTYLSYSHNSEDHASFLHCILLYI